MEPTFTFLRVRGIPIGAHWSWIFVLGLVIWSLSSQLFPETYPGLEESSYLLMGAVTAVLFFASILLHELGHAFQALKEGMRVQGITLWLFGGVASAMGAFPSPGAEFRIAIAGPIVSVVLAAVFGLISLFGSRGGLAEPVQGVADYLARINAILVAFNLVPALPLDGGRVLRSWLWYRQRSFTSATSAAARAGKAFGGLLAVVGLLNFITGGATGGIWLVLLGWFLVQAAQSEATMAVVQHSLAGRRVRDLMTPAPATVAPDLTLNAFIDDVLQARGYSTYPVVGDHGVVGLMPVRALAAVPPAARSGQRVADVMVPRERVPVVTPDLAALDAFEILRPEPRRALVMDDGRLVGILSITDLLRTLELQKALGIRAEPEARRTNPLVWGAVGLVMAIAAGALYHPPLAVLEPGAALEISKDIRISGVPTHAIKGSYLLTSIQLEQRSALGVLFAAMSPEEDVVALREVVPANAEPDDFAREQRALFRQSRLLAAAAAARAVGLRVAVRGSGALVQDLLPESPASRVLREGDVIVAIDGQPVKTANDVEQHITSQPPGTRFRITIQRAGARRDVEATSKRLRHVPEGLAGIGVFLATRNLSIQLPFKVQFEERYIGGPSAGFAYALAIADLLSATDYARGRKIAATGTIDLRGEVGPVGGTSGKAVAAAEEGAQLLLVPDAQVQDISPDDLQVRGVSSLREALGALAATS